MRGLQSGREQRYDDAVAVLVLSTGGSRTYADRLDFGAILAAIAADGAIRGSLPQSMSALPDSDQFMHGHELTPNCNYCTATRERAQKRYSITSSAVASRVGGTVRPSDLAVLRLITSSYLSGSCTGRSAGFSPLRMRST